MKRKLLISLIITLLSMPILTLAQTGSSYYDDNTTVFVNTEAFGVHKEYDNKRGCYVWKDSMGGFICLDKNMKPIEEMDKHVHFTGSNNDPDNPEVSPFSGVRKVWDQKRGCYVWKDIYTGDFLGTDKSSVHQQEKAKQKGTGKETTQQKQNTGKKGQPKQNTGKKDQQNSQQQVGKQEQPKEKRNVETNNTTEEMIITTDEQLRQAEAAIKEAKAAVAYAKAHGVDVNEYGPVEQYIKQAEDAINDYKRKRNLK
jgi:hypothetical protein